MQVIYGSQNFGYDISTSDRDFAQIVYPGIEDIMAIKDVNTTEYNPDGSITKIIDIRKLPYLLEKSNFSDLQILYSQEVTNAEDFNWFFENREAIVRHNLKQLYDTNAGFIKSCIHRYEKDFDNRHLIRAQAFTNMLVRLTDERTPFFMREPELSQMRMFNSPINASTLLFTLHTIKPYFEKQKDISISNLITNKVEDLLKQHLKSILD